MGSSTVVTALVQSTADLDPEVNRRRAAEKIHEAADRGARIVCLPELFASRYFCVEEKIEHFDLAEAVLGPSVQLLRPIARERGIVVVAPIFEMRAAGLYHNSAVVVDADGEVCGQYRKMHIPHDPHFFEKYYFTPGDLGFQAIPTRYATIGVLICWDQWFPEAARLTALRGAEILFYPTAIGWLHPEKEEIGRAQHDAWETVQRGHAIANSCYVAAANRVGVEGPIEFWGQSFACDCMGQIAAKAGEGEEILLFDFDRAEVAETRRQWPFLRDRRIDAYGDLARRRIDP